MTLALFPFLSFLTATVVFATNPSVTVVQSLDKQLVQVARVGQPYSWTFSEYTFNSSDGPLTFTTSLLPSWLGFDNLTRTFEGTPSASDEGYPDITVTAHASTSSTSSRFTICVTHYAPPVLNLPLSEQFVPTSPSLSSVFFLRSNSALITENPALRVPRKWSFSIGLQSNTFQSDRNIFYELRLANDSSIPMFLNFNSRTVTLDGVTPSAEIITEPVLLPLALHASDQEGYTAIAVPFDLIIADHELSRTTDSLPTINVTTETSFVISLLSAVDFMGILVDGDPIQPSNISRLDIDVSNHSSWLRYDVPSRTLSGKPPTNITGSPTLPVILETPFNQSIKTQVSLALVESYFVMSDLPSLHVSRGDQIIFDLAQWFSPSRANPGYDHTNLSASFEPTASANWLRFDELTNNLTGTVPETYESTSDHITITFTAYSHETRSTSHAILTVYVTNTSNTKSLAPSHPNGLSTEAHRRLILAIAITFGTLGGMCTLAGIFAILRRCARVEDTAFLDEEGRHAWSEKDRRWYGLTLSPNGTRIVEKSDPIHSSPMTRSPGRRSNRAYSPLGLDLRRVSERSQRHSSSNEELLSPAVMSKKEFLSRIKETVRKVSNKYARKDIPPTIRPVIGKPILVASSRLNDQDHIDSPSNPFDDIEPLSRPGSAFISGSPSASTAEHSIPRRRADFATPRNPAQVHFNDGLLVRQVSTGSMGANSFVSGRSGLSANSYAEVSMGPPTRPRLVPFTNSTRVPVPHVVMPTGQGAGFASNRITSQRANVIVEGVKPSGSSDGLSMGIHYVRSLGADQLAVNSSHISGSSPVLSNVRSSFASLESSHVGHKSAVDMQEMRVLVRVGERFKFRVAIPGKHTSGFYVKLTSGQPLPKFIHADLNGISNKGALEFTGVATFHEIGERVVGIYAEKDGVCVASVVIEVVGKR
ncbi:Axial budding pattern protein 2 [Psilocybe cubensis]|uniref:Axial budding pattern protein 2 n=2 Tax=Psilocybe cubensis TaxID=181762 RepID=A0ACB8GVU0_PSICU|nr:Axial budding pattern protein 2 [Psilocybe cubensis]KAH9479552.1 Axial budding pattern protein 2 [Psilocybe cubensis]